MGEKKIINENVKKLYVVHVLIEGLGLEL